MVKCDCMMNKIIWYGAFDSQIVMLASKIASAARAITAEERALSITQIGDEESESQNNVIIPSVAVKEAEICGTCVNIGENHPLTSPFNHSKDVVSSIPTLVNLPPPSNEEPPQTPRTATRMLLMSFVSSPNLITAMEAQSGETSPAGGAELRT